MKLSEFNAWLEGFEEAIDGSPTKKQWVKIKARLATVKPDQVTTVISNPIHYIESYQPPWRIYWGGDQFYTTCEANGMTTLYANSIGGALSPEPGSFDTPELAWLAVGLLEAINS